MSNPSPGPQSPHHDAHSAVEAAEEFVERAVEAAERSLARRLGAHGVRVVVLGLRVLLLVLLVAYFAFGAAVLVTRYYLLPHVDEWREGIEQAATSALHAGVRVEAAEADWYGLEPHVMLRKVELSDPAGGVALTLPQVDLVLSWTTFLTWRPRLHSLLVESPELQVKRLSDDRYTVAGFAIDTSSRNDQPNVLDWVLDQQHIRIRDARVHYVDERPGAAAPDVAGASDEARRAPRLDFENVDFLLTSGITGHKFSLRLVPPAHLASAIDVRGEFRHPWRTRTSHVADWSGEAFVQVDYADLARIDAWTHLIPASARLDTARGAVRAWMDFFALRVTRVRADVALEDVRAQLGEGLPPLVLDHLSGRITHSIWSDDGADAQETQLAGFQLDGPDGIRLPATDLGVRRTQARHGDDADAPQQFRLTASRIDLDDWARLAYRLPLPAEWEAAVARAAAHGTLEDVRASWSGTATPPASYSLRARFSGLGAVIEAAPEADEAPTTAVAHLDGTVDFNQDGGTLRLDSTGAQVVLRNIMVTPEMAFDTLSGQVRWRRSAQAGLELDFDDLRAANADLALGVAGNYRSGVPGGAVPHIDVSGRMSRAHVATTWRYLPVITGHAAYAWLQGGLRDGEVSAATFYLHGDPRRFPFGDGGGNFHAAMHVRDARVDVAPASANPARSATDNGWPLITGIEGDVVFDQDLLVISARRARAYDFELNAVTARLNHLDKPNGHLLVDGQGAGALAELLRYANDSPVRAWSGGWLESSVGSGPSSLRVKLDIPLEHASDARVDGAVGFRDDRLVLRPDIAPFASLRGELGFNERGIRLTGLSADFLGGSVRASGLTQSDGAVVINAEGTATPQGTKSQVAPPLIKRLLDGMRGTTHYTLGLRAKGGSLGLRVDSDLVGVSAELPAPLRKAAGEVRRFHLEDLPIPGSLPERDVLRVQYGDAVAIELQRIDGGGTMNVERGFVALGKRPTLPERGLLVALDAPRLDLDAWTDALGARAELDSGAGGGGADIDWIDRVTLRADEVKAGGRTAHHVVLGARREAEPSWSVDVDADEVSGSVHWMGGRAGAPARLSARLAHLAVPEGEKKPDTGASGGARDYPDLDIVADQFELGSGKLGRLELEAQNSAGGAWNLRKLQVTNPDGHLSATGSWERTGAGAAMGAGAGASAIGTPGAAASTGAGGSGARRMAVKFSLAYGNAGGMLGRFGFPGAVKNGSGKIEGDLAWTGSPFAIDYPSLGGALHLVTDKGQFLKADAGAGRLLGILSLQSLAHRVTGDFRDLFSEGFAFDSLGASATISNGHLTTDDFILKGVNAAVRIKGTVNLLEETQNLQVVVIPEINADAALAYALINPAIGLGVFVTQFLLKKPLAAAFTNYYEVSGSWSDPLVKSVRSSAAQGATAAPSS